MTGRRKTTTGYGFHPIPGKEERRNGDKREDRYGEKPKSIGQHEILKCRQLLFKISFLYHRKYLRRNRKDGEDANTKERKDPSTEASCRILSTVRATWAEITVERTLSSASGSIGIRLSARIEGRLGWMARRLAWRGCHLPDTQEL